MSNHFGLTKSTGGGKLQWVEEAVGFRGYLERDTIAALLVVGSLGAARGAKSHGLHNCQGIRQRKCGRTPK